jgi:hypothetical protein
MNGLYTKRVGEPLHPGAVVVVLLCVEGSLTKETDFSFFSLFPFSSKR